MRFGQCEVCSCNLIKYSTDEDPRICGACENKRKEYDRETEERLNRICDEAWEKSMDSYCRKTS